MLRVTDLRTEWNDGRTEWIIETANAKIIDRRRYMELIPELDLLAAEAWKAGSFIFVYLYIHQPYNHMVFFFFFYRQRDVTSFHYLLPLVLHVLIIVSIGCIHKSSLDRKSKINQMKISTTMFKTQLI